MKNFIEKHCDWWFASGVIIGVSVPAITGNLHHPFAAGVVLGASVALAIYNAALKREEK